MTIKEFFGKLTSKIIWVNLLIMFLLIVAISVGVWIGLERYTMHGVEITVPNVKGMRIDDARRALEQQGLVAIVADSGYNNTLPSGTVLEQTPANASRVKPGREIYLTINTTRTPTLQIPDIADNSSLREAEARLTAMGFKLSPCEYVEGEKDWVYGVKYLGRNVFGGDRVPINAELTLQVGSGTYENDSLDVENNDSLTGADNDELYNKDQDAPAPDAY
ncbi:MAG: PASTA domain-containing protein [Paraprevotella sp.]|nr:PASTA domain-containing protein [Paraprevotella sp.]